MNWNWLQDIPTALLLATRLSGLFLTAPFFSSDAIATRLKAGLVLSLTVLFWPVAGAAALAGARDPLAWLGAGLTELAIGAAIGLSAQIVFEAAQLAGTVVSFQMGLSLETAFDPSTGADSSLMATLHQLVMLYLFLQLGLHRELLYALAGSLHRLPLGSSLAGFSPRGWLGLFGQVFAWGVQLALPVLLVTMLLDFTLAFFSKLAPQLPVMLFGIPVKSLAAYVILLAAVHWWPMLLRLHFDQALRAVWPGLGA